MAIPTFGNFNMFGAGADTSIQGAIESGGGDTTGVDNFNGLITVSNPEFFDPIYAGVVNSTADITSSLQYRNYPQIVLSPISCSSNSSFSGGIGYPTTQPYNLTVNTGSVDFQFNAVGIPDRFIVYYNSVAVIDTGYRGSSAYAFLGSSRGNFTSSLDGKVDPVTSNTYPFSHPSHSADNYPAVISPGTGSDSFNKDSNLVNQATIEVYAPMSGTAWNLTLNCPATGSAPTGSIEIASVRLKSSQSCGGNSTGPYTNRVWIDTTRLPFNTTTGKVNNGSSINTLDELTVYSPGDMGTTVATWSIDQTGTSVAPAGTYLVSDDSLTTTTNDVEAVMNLSGNITLQTCGL